MSGDLDHVCERCGTTVDYASDHAEIVRREFRGEPQPSKVEYLCGRCLEEYEGAFLDGG